MKIDKELLKEFCEIYGCDGFREIKVTDKRDEYVVLRFDCWDGNTFWLKVVEIK